MAEQRNTLSATNLATYHHLNCDLYIHNVYHNHHSAPTPDGLKGSEGQLLTVSQYRRGVDWETALYAWLDASDLLLKVPGLPLQVDVLLENILADERDHFFITGITYIPPRNRLRERFFRSGTEPVEFGVGKPDLLEIRRDERGIHWKVIDAKASKVVKTSHHAQIYFYTLCLEYLLDHPSFHPSGEAGIWLPPAEGFNSPSVSGIKSIQTSLLSRSLDAFIFERLPKLLSAPRETVRWHFNPRCQGCKYSAECREEAVSKGKLGSMPNVSISDAWVLQDMLDSSERSGTDIEDLHRLVTEGLPNLERKLPLVAKKGRRILGIRSKRVADKSSTQVSPIVDSAREGKVQVIPRRNFTCPNSEDVAVVISLVQDPASPETQIEYFAISVFGSNPRTYSGGCDEFVPTLALTIRELTSSTTTTQFYVWSAAEQALLQAHLIRQALVGDLDAPDTRLCIGTLSQGASLLQTAFQPILLSGALLSFLAKNKRLKAEYQACLERMGQSTQGTVPELRARVVQELQRLQQVSRRTDEDPQQLEIGKVPKVVVLKKELERMLAFPIAGYWDLRECAECLLDEGTKTAMVIPTDEDIFVAFKAGITTELVHLMTSRNVSVHKVLCAARQCLGRAGQNLLVNGANRLTTDFMDVCRQSHLRKLFFMQQFEVLSKLNELWSNRMDGCPECPVLEYRGKADGARGVDHNFSVVSGTVDIPSTDRDMSFFDYLLTEDVRSDTEIPVEAMFDDLAVCGLVVPFNRWTKPHWDSQHPTVKGNLLLADLRNVSSIQRKLIVTVRTYGSAASQVLVPGRHYRLSPRLVDFNTTKVLSSLFELDLLWENQERPAFAGEANELKDHRGVPFLQLIMDPRSFGRVQKARECLAAEENTQRVFRNLKALGVPEAGNLLLKPSQHRATQRLLANRLAVIWGPPGTGKTHTIALSILRVLEAEWKLHIRGQKVIFLTAMTHAAIDACQNKLEKLMEYYRAIEHLELDWLEDVRVERVAKGSDHPSPPRTSNATYIYAGTLYQLYNFSRARDLHVDCIIADEAGQIALASFSLVLRCLVPTGRVIIAGDSEQLAPIFSGTYPRLKTAPLFSSVLDCVVFSQGDGPVVTSGSQSQGESQEGRDDGGHTIVQLTENFRLNPDLGEFVATIYSRQFKPQKVQPRSLALRLRDVVRMSETERDVTRLAAERDVLRTVQVFLLGLSDVMLRKPQSVLKPPRFSGLKMPLAELEEGSNPAHPNHHPVSLSLLRLKTWSSLDGQQFGYETHVHGEAALAASLVAALRHCAPDDDIFIATPHRVQREAVKAALARLKRREETLEDKFKSMGVREPGSHMKNVTVDTVERLQGSEASFVVCLFSLPELHSADLGFLLGRRRLNVAISRAKTLCILVTSTQVLCPPVSVFADEETAKGYAFLKAYEDRAWSYDLSVDVGML